MKDQVLRFLFFLFLSFSQNALTANYCLYCCSGTKVPYCPDLCNSDTSFQNRCTKCTDESPYNCREPFCGDSCTVNPDCYGAYFTDSCTTCHHVKKQCVKPECAEICDAGGFSCSGADVCTKCDPISTLCMQPECGANCTFDAECKGTMKCTKCEKGVSVKPECGTACG